MVPEVSSSLTLTLTLTLALTLALTLTLTQAAIQAKLRGGPAEAPKATDSDGASTGLDAAGAVESAVSGTTAEERKAAEPDLAMISV